MAVNKHVPKALFEIIEHFDDGFSTDNEIEQGLNKWRKSLTLNDKIIIKEWLDEVEDGKDRV